MPKYRKYYEKLYENIELPKELNILYEVICYYVYFHNNEILENTKVDSELNMFKEIIA